jgi:molybdate transport system regulatory protein
MFNQISRWRRRYNRTLLDAHVCSAQSSAMTRLTIRIDLTDDAAFGPGKARLLELIEKTGSIRGAAAAMSMSYRRAWLLLKEIETVIGAPALATRTGGAKGGGASLTERGRTVLEHYRTIEQRATQAVASELRALAQITSGSPSRAKRLQGRLS